MAETKNAAETKNVKMSTTPTTLVVGIVGMGDHTCRSHLPQFRAHPRVQVTKYFDPGVAPENMSYTAGLEPTTSLEHLLADTTINAIFIASPDRFHPEQLYQCVKAGKHVLVEKPLAIDKEGLNIVIESMALAQEKNLLISSCHPRRYDPPVAWMKENTPFSQVTHFTFRFLYHKPTDAWKSVRSLMLDHLGHEVDMLHFFFPTHTITSIKKVFDSGHAYSVTGTTDQGLGFEFTGHRTLEEKKYYEWVDLVFKDGTVANYNLNGGKMFFQGEERNIPAKSYDIMFDKVVNGFVEAVLEGTTNYLSPKDMLRNTEIGIRLKHTK